jgi:hypothetical protein
MLDDRVYEGTIVKCEGGILYLRVPNPNRQYGPYTELILTLLLVETKLQFAL